MSRRQNRISNFFGTLLLEFVGLVAFLGIFAVAQSVSTSDPSDRQAEVQQEVPATFNAFLTFPEKRAFDMMRTGGGLPDQRASALFSNGHHSVGRFPEMPGDSHPRKLAGPTLPPRVRVVWFSGIWNLRGDGLARGD